MKYSFRVAIDGRSRELGTKIGNGVALGSERLNIANCALGLGMTFSTIARGAGYITLESWR